MTKIEQINNILKSQRNGTFVSVKTVANQERKVSAAYKKNTTVIKESVITAIKGTSYENRKPVKEKKLAFEEAGETCVSKRDPIYEAIPGYDRRTFCRSIKNPDKQYLILYPCGGAHNVKYYMDGVQKSKEYLKEWGVMQPSYWNRSSSSDRSHMVISIDNIEEINGKKVK